MEIKLYKLYNTETGKFNAGGDHWTSKGKCWNQKNHLTTKLTSYCREIVRIMHWPGWNRQRELSEEEYDFYHDDTNKQAMYDRFIPETWIVIEITNNGARELCKARYWLTFK
jgi:hypothetical protein